MTNDLNHRMTAFKLTHAQLAILEYLLQKEEATSLVDIAKYLNVEKSTITRVVKHLETNNYIVHVPSKDSRERRIMLSEASHEIQSSLQQTKDAFENTAFHNISDEELDITYQTLLKILNNLNGDENAPHD
jgi:MarR family transcriptional regulator, transcriptional regulator for hemolysin